MRKYIFAITIVLFLITAGIVYLTSTSNSFTSSTNSTNSTNSSSFINSTIGSDSKGYVTKTVYASPGPHKVKIAVITGIHPREKLAIDPVINLIKNYPLTHDVEIINYAINVQDHPDDYTIGRNNGEKLAAEYIVPDINNTKPDLVIICHAHQLNYGSGFFITTPAMDNNSVTLAENVRKTIPEFRYYDASDDARANATSNIRVSEPIAIAGYPVFVYEVPEWVSVGNATNVTYQLIDTSFNIINSNK